jgi:hypothetical protein
LHYFSDFEDSDRKIIAATRQKGFPPFQTIDFATVAVGFIDLLHNLQLLSLNHPDQDVSIETTHREVVLILLLFAKGNRRNRLLQVELTDRLPF